MTRLTGKCIIGGFGVALTAAMLAEGCLVVAALGSARAAARERARRQADWRQLAAARPGATEAGAAAAEAGLARAEAALAESWQSLGRWCESTRPQRDAAVASESRVDAFLALAGFARRMREEAERAGVTLRPDEHFGFALYAHEGPAAELAAAVDDQRRHLEQILTVLWAARPSQLDAVQRTLPAPDRTRPAPARQSPGTPAGDHGDLFEFDPVLSLAAPRLIETDAYRLAFVGSTSVLRRFLNGIASSDDPLVVRALAVEPVKEAASRSGKKPDRSDALVLVLRPGVSRFLVTVESFALVGAPPPAGPVTARRARMPAAGGRWPEAAPQRGPGWVFDLFTPPSLYFEPGSGALRAAAAAASPDVDARFALELLAVERAPFRWQLAGYVRGARGLRGIFADADDGDIVMAGEGDGLGGPHWVVKRLTLRGAVAEGDDACTTDPEAVAVVADDAAGTELILSSRGPCKAGAPVAVFTSRDDPGIVRRLQEGQSLKLRGVDYCVERIDAQVPQAVVAWKAPGEEGPVTLNLTPRISDAASDPAPARPSPQQSVTTVSLAP